MISRLLSGNGGEEEEEEREVERVRSMDHERVPVGGSTVQALPLQLIERNRLTTEQIKKLPRFVDYSPGNPSSVSVTTHFQY